MAEFAGWKIYDYNELASTNDKAKEQSSKFDGCPLVISAVSQTAGRGRRGRSWVSEEGNLFFSQLLQTEITISDLVFIASLSVAESILEITPQLNIKIKWPNDVLIDGKKTCGILLEQGENKTTIIGVGVNLQKVPAEDNIIYPVTSLNEYGIEISREQFVQIYLSKFNHWLDIRLYRGFGAIRDAWLQKAAYIDELIKVNCAQNSLSGIFKGIDEQGFLLLEQEEKLMRIAAGDVFI